MIPISTVAAPAPKLRGATAELWEFPRLATNKSVNGLRVTPRPIALASSALPRWQRPAHLGLVEGGDEIASIPRPRCPRRPGHVILFSINPVYRGETRGTYSLVLNASKLRHLNAGRTPAEK